MNKVSGAAGSGRTTIVMVTVADAYWMTAADIRPVAVDPPEHDAAGITAASATYVAGP